MFTRINITKTSEIIINKDQLTYESDPLEFYRHEMIVYDHSYLITDYDDEEVIEVTLDCHYIY